jgi:hypothetical protein
MSQSLVRNLLAAGGTTDAAGEINYFLFVDAKKSFLNCQHWKGETLSTQELLVDSVRPNSTAALIITPKEKIAISISPSSTLQVHTYDQDESEWTESEESPIANKAVHPNGKLVASPDASGRYYIFFQDPSKSLISLQYDTWTRITLPVSPIAGTPISTLATEDELHVYYISASDNFIHGAVRGSDGVWKDEVAIKYAFTEEIRSFCLGENESYVLTAKNTLLKVSAEGNKTQLGTVKDGKFVPETKEEAKMTTYYYNNRGKVIRKRVIKAGKVTHYGK